MVCINIPVSVTLSGQILSGYQSLAPFQQVLLSVGARWSPVTNPVQIFFFAKFSCRPGHASDNRAVRRAIHYVNAASSRSPNAPAMAFLVCYGQRSSCASHPIVPLSLSPLHRLPGASCRVAFSPDGNVAVFSGRLPTPHCPASQVAPPVCLRVMRHHSSLINPSLSPTVLWLV